LLGVLAFHTEGALTGGYLGVDLFFVLSGFLITRILLHEHAVTGAIDLSSFWVRRARRLFPALLSLMPAIALYAHFVARPEELTGIRGDALATLGYIANWRAIWSHKTYFDLFLSPSPLEHTWSLSIEEQFYVVWPLLVMMVLRWRGSRALLAVSLGLAALSMLAMLVLFDSARTTRVYYGTDTRAAALLGGAAFAIFSSRSPLGRARMRWLDASGVVAMLGLAYAWWTIDGRDFLLYRGGFWLTEALSLVLLACALAGPNSFVARALSVRPLRAIGSVSYGAYLWHWPVNLVLTAERAQAHGLALYALRLLVTFAIAALSYRFLEQPIRRNGLRFGRAGWVVPAAFALACCSVVAGTRAGPVPRVARAPVMTATPAAPVPVRFRVRVLGDSTANALGWTLRSVAEPDVHVELRAKDGLNLIDADELHWPHGDANIDATIIGVGGAFLYGIHVRAKWTVACSPQWDALFETGLERHLREVVDTPKGVWISTLPYPLGPYDNASRRQQVDCINASIRRVAVRYSKAKILDLAALVCPNGECEREVNGVPLRPDGVHFNVPAAAKLARKVLALIDPAGHRATRL
jgi:peptidoglycan/LPS O-acetylase OafA/YrhL